ncbi:DUF4365 domain-containing protein [Azohydromonas aeria]|uniref:DUF4365 domain-containing protein n=1 Tax=Azohydromonas aeria TaxID=2590212 RepID=UPI0012FB1896|nr:DUF4365 domain-containing protein [Azohydromonas aeria]
MDPNEQKQQFSVALVRAVAAVCGLAYAEPGTDDDSIDATIARRGGGGTVRSPKLDLQLKCTGRPDFRDDVLAFPLLKKNYDELRPIDVMVPRILVVVALPDHDPNSWLTCSQDEYVAKRCAYWMSLRGRPDTLNDTSVTVHLPRTQVFDPLALHGMFDRLCTGNLP